MYIYTYTHTHTYTYILYTHTHIHVYIYTYTRTHAHIHIYMYYQHNSYMTSNIFVTLTYNTTEWFIIFNCVQCIIEKLKKIIFVLYITLCRKRGNNSGHYKIIAVFHADWCYTYSEYLHMQTYIHYSVYYIYIESCGLPRVDMSI
jgi:hypothetical protein